MRPSGLFPPRSKDRSRDVQSTAAAVEMSDEVIKSVNDNSIGAMWGRLVFFTVVASSTIHALAAAVSCWSVVLNRPRLVCIVVLVHFAVGAVYSFVSCGVLSFAVALTLFTINRSQLGNTEMTVYVSIMTAFITFFSWGRTTLWYAF